LALFRRICVFINSLFVLLRQSPETGVHLQASVFADRDNRPITFSIEFLTRSVAAFFNHSRENSLLRLDKRLQSEPISVVRRADA